MVERRRAGWMTALALGAVGFAAPVAQAQQFARAGHAPADAAAAAAIGEQARGDVAAFYRTRGFWPIWVEGGTIGPAADALLALLPTVAADGLDPARYDPQRLAAAVAAARAGDDPATVAAAELALSATLAALIADMRTPRVGMTYADPSLMPRRDGAAMLLRRAALAPSLANYVARVRWMSPLYLGLRQAIAGKRAAGPRIDLDPGDAALFGGVARPGTRGTAALRLNLERARLLPDAFTPHIVVDAASARLWYIADGAVAGTMRVVVGTPETPTPMLAGMLRHATLNPYWNVPVDLVRKRIAPAILRGASLDAMGYELLSDWSDAAEPIDPRLVDWRAVADGALAVRVRELPGGANAMGAIKFSFPNDEGIYLHDTPNRALFVKADRHFSNGCVRLEDAARLGRWLTGVTLAPRSDRPEQHVALPRPMPVFLTYLTARAGAGGVETAADVYGRDRTGGARWGTGAGAP